MMAALPLPAWMRKAAALLFWCGLAAGLSLWLARSIMLWDVVGFVPILGCLAVGLAVWIALRPVIGLYLFIVVNFLLPRLIDLNWLPLRTFWLNDLVLFCWAA